MRAVPSTPLLIPLTTSRSAQFGSTGSLASSSSPDSTLLRTGSRRKSRFDNSSPNVTVTGATDAQQGVLNRYKKFYAEALIQQCHGFIDQIENRPDSVEAFDSSEAGFQKLNASLDRLEKWLSVPSSRPAAHQMDVALIKSAELPRWEPEPSTQQAEPASSSGTHSPSQASGMASSVSSESLDTDYDLVETLIPRDEFSKHQEALSRSWGDLDNAALKERMTTWQDAMEKCGHRIDEDDYATALGSLRQAVDEEALRCIEKACPSAPDDLPYRLALALSTLPDVQALLQDDKARHHFLISAQVPVGLVKKISPELLERFHSLAPFIVDPKEAPAIKKMLSWQSRFDRLRREAEKTNSDVADGLAKGYAQVMEKDLYRDVNYQKMFNTWRSRRGGKCLTAQALQSERRRVENAAQQSIEKLDDRLATFFEAMESTFPPVLSQQRRKLSPYHGAQPPLPTNDSNQQLKLLADIAALMKGEGAQQVAPGHWVLEPASATQSLDQQPQMRSRDTVCDDLTLLCSGWGNFDNKQLSTRIKDFHEASTNALRSGLITQQDHNDACLLRLQAASDEFTFQLEKQFPQKSVDQINGLFQRLTVALSAWQGAASEFDDQPQSSDDTIRPEVLDRLHRLACWIVPPEEARAIQAEEGKAIAAEQARTKRFEALLQLAQQAGASSVAALKTQFKKIESDYCDSSDNKEIDRACKQLFEEWEAALHPNSQAEMRNMAKDMLQEANLSGITVYQPDRLRSLSECSSQAAQDLLVKLKNFYADWPKLTNKVFEQKFGTILLAINKAQKNGLTKEEAEVAMVELDAATSDYYIELVKQIDANIDYEKLLKRLFYKAPNLNNAGVRSALFCQYGARPSRAKTVNVEQANRLKMLSKMIEQTSARLPD